MNSLENGSEESSGVRKAGGQLTHDSLVSSSEWFDEKDEINVPMALSVFRDGEEWFFFFLLHIIYIILLYRQVLFFNH